MSEMLLTIQHNGKLFSPPIVDGVQIEWERTEAPGKLTFTTIKQEGNDMNFQEGDPVCFYYDDKNVFMGYVFKKQRDKEHHIEVTCYDQLRYLKNKYTYVFENKTASQIIKALCDDFNLHTDGIENTKYVIPVIAEENISAMDIAMDVLEETLLNTGDLFVLYDDFGKLTLKNSANMVSKSVIMQDTAENFDYSSSIDDETYNQIILYYKEDDKLVQLYTASSPTTIKQWGTLRYFEEVSTPTIGQNKANALLKLHNRKTRELKVTGAFGDVSVRGGTLIPVQLYVGDTSANNYMQVTKVTHNFENDHYTMDLTLEGEWSDPEYGGVSKTIGTLPTKPSTTETEKEDFTEQIEPTKKRTLKVHCNGVDAYAGKIHITNTVEGITKTTAYLDVKEDIVVECDENTNVEVRCIPKEGNGYTLSKTNALWDYGAYAHTTLMDSDRHLWIKWVKNPSVVGNMPNNYPCRISFESVAFGGVLPSSWGSVTVNYTYQDQQCTIHPNRTTTIACDENTQVTVIVTTTSGSHYRTVIDADELWLSLPNGYYAFAVKPLDITISVEYDWGENN